MVIKFKTIAAYDTVPGSLGFCFWLQVLVFL